jgi:aspartate aminotransferase-like enzyme
MAHALWHPRSDEFSGLLRDVSENEFSGLLRDVSERLATLFCTRNDVLTLTSSGTGAMEAATVNFLRRGERVITVDGGKFGERWGEIAGIYGLDAVTLKEVRRALG